MRVINPLLAALLVCTLCSAAGAAQTIHISGVVVDSAGAGIEGAAVKLEKASIATTSAADGSFTLTGEPASSMRPIPARLSGGIRAVVSKEGLRLHLDSPSDVEIAAYSLRGRMLFGLKERMGAGTHSFALPIMGSGIHLYRVAIGNTQYSFTSMLPGHLESTPSAQEQKRPHGALYKGAKAAQVIEDVIAVSKDGYLIYRVTVANSDTSGIQIEMVPSAGAVTDANGNVYQTVRIGSQVWTAQNLRTTKFTNGEPIPEVHDHSAWAKRTSPAYCYYKNTRDTTAIKKFGALYNYHAVSAYEGNLAPPGWHVPSDAEWDTLQNYLITNGYNWDGTTTENKIAKSLAARTNWEESGAAGAPGNEMWKNNKSGFSAVAAGYREWAVSGDPYDYIDFVGIGGYTGWWSATELDISYAWYRGMNRAYFEFRGGSIPKSCGYSVRLVKD